jgi:predicted RNA-binding Zn-ribbon protein involved in translation (DUF1610 family)
METQEKDWLRKIRDEHMALLNRMIGGTIQGAERFSFVFPSDDLLIRDKDDPEKMRQWESLVLRKNQRVIELARRPRCPECGTLPISKGVSWLCPECGRWYIKIKRIKKKVKDKTLQEKILEFADQHPLMGLKDIARGVGCHEQLVIYGLYKDGLRRGEENERITL